MKKIVNAYRAGTKLVKEILHLISVPKFPQKSVGDYLYTSASFDDIVELESIYVDLNGTRFRRPQRLSLLFNIRKRLLVVKTNENGSEKIVGMNFYYLNNKDLKEKTIHEGFIGVLPNHRGQGLATEMRKIAILHFSRSRFKGISTRISKKNLGSLRSAEKLGFVPAEEYFDFNMDETRYYMVCKFRNDRD
jgi:RimJ/RimL family protein N-acetyltransferase